MAKTAKSTIKPFQFNASDVLGALALEADRICGAAKLYSHGAAFPDPNLIAGTIERMKELNKILLDHKESAEKSINRSAAVN
jgi:hypothetical protein